MADYDSDTTKGCQCVSYQFYGSCVQMVSWFVNCQYFWFFPQSMCQLGPFSLSVTQRLPSGQPIAFNSQRTVKSTGFPIIREGELIVVLWRFICPLLKIPDRFGSGYLTRGGA